MAKVISQETYDEAFKENLELMDNSVSEARTETIAQFQAMGVNLANIITDLTINESTGVPVLNETVLQIKSMLESDEVLDQTELKIKLGLLHGELGKSIPHRVLACNKLKANEYLIQLLEREVVKTNVGSDSVLNQVVICAIALTNQNPDIFDGKCHELVLEILKNQNDIEVVSNTLKWVQKSCYLHEKNRQMLLNTHNFLKHLKILLNDRNEETKILKAVNACFRFLVLDDDIRVEFGKAHDHAKMIATECLTDLTTLMKKFEKDADVFGDILLTISTLLVRNEYCQTVADAGGVSCILNAFIFDFENQNDNIKVVRESLKVLKALSGNDNVKVEIIKLGAAASICMGLTKFKVDETIAKSALLCISSLTLRVKENSTAFWETGIGETILETMKIHEKSAMVQRNGAWAIRNMVSRSREQCPEWLCLGAEDILTAASKNHPSIEPDAKAALRDLGAKVKLKEEWVEQSKKLISHDQN